MARVLTTVLHAASTIVLPTCNSALETSDEPFSLTAGRLSTVRKCPQNPNVGISPQHTGPPSLLMNR